MTPRISVIAVTLAGLGITAGTGCLKRSETITVTRAGQVTIELEFDGPDGAINKIERRFAKLPGWTCSREPKRHNKEDELLHASRTFERGATLPSLYGPPDDPDDPDVDQELQFPTQVEFERRRDGTYVHFRRVYQPRRWAYIAYWRDAYYADEADELSEKEIEELTREDRIQVLKAFAFLEAQEQIALAKAALAECDPQLPQDQWLLARGALWSLYENVDFDFLVDLFEQTPKDDRDAVLARETERIPADALDAFRSTLASAARYHRAELARFDRSYERARRYHEITEELGGHFFEIRVKLPGPIVAHNADKLEDENTVAWEFDGKAFRDREHTLMASAKLGN